MPIFVRWMRNFVYRMPIFFIECPFLCTEYTFYLLNIDFCLLNAHFYCFVNAHFCLLNAKFCLPNLILFYSQNLPASFSNETILAQYSTYLRSQFRTYDLLFTPIRSIYTRNGLIFSFLFSLVPVSAHQLM